MQCNELGFHLRTLISAIDLGTLLEQVLQLLRMSRQPFIFIDSSNTL